MEDVLPFTTLTNACSEVAWNSNTRSVDFSDPRLQERRNSRKVSFGCSEVTFISHQFIQVPPQMVGNGVSVCPFASELSPTQRGCDWAWRWCTGRPITLSWWWTTVHSWPLRPVSPAHTLAWSCRVSKARQLSACSWVCAFSDEWKRVRSLVLCFSDDAEGEATHHRRRRCRGSNRHPCCKLSSFTVTMFALWVWGGKKENIKWPINVWRGMWNLGQCACVHNRRSCVSLTSGVYYRIPQKSPDVIYFQPAVKELYEEIW